MHTNEWIFCCGNCIIICALDSIGLSSNVYFEADVHRTSDLGPEKWYSAVRCANLYAEWVYFTFSKAICVLLIPWIDIFAINYYLNTIFVALLNAIRHSTIYMVFTCVSLFNSYKYLSCLIKILCIIRKLSLYADVKNGKNHVDGWE